MIQLVKKNFLEDKKLLFNVEQLNRKYTPYSYLNLLQKYNSSKEKYMNLMEEMKN